MMKNIIATTLALASTTSLAYAQTYSTCNPLYSTCPANPALGGNLNVDFTKGSSSRFASSNPARLAYDSNGAEFTVAASGDSPTISSDFYIMFGRVEVVMQAAPGVGIVSSVVLQSDDLDEIDWEWLGGDTTQVQTNYFGKGNTASYNRATFAAVTAPQTSVHKYTVDWTASAITWSIDGVAVRTLAYADAEGGGSYYPQTPMQVKIGIWAGGDPSNSAGTIQWAGGYTDYSTGPFTMSVKSVNVQDYSSGTGYQYNGNAGTWQSISAIGGTVGTASGTNVQNSPQGATSTAPATALTNIPISGGIPSTLVTVTRSATTATSASDYWAGTGFRVSSASTSISSSTIAEESTTTTTPIDTYVPLPTSTSVPTIAPIAAPSSSSPPTTLITSTVAPAAAPSPTPYANPWWTQTSVYSDPWWTPSANAAEAAWTPSPTALSLAPSSSVSATLLYNKVVTAAGETSPSSSSIAVVGMQASKSDASSGRRFLSKYLLLSVVVCMGGVLGLLV